MPRRHLPGDPKPCRCKPSELFLSRLVIFITHSLNLWGSASSCGMALPYNKDKIINELTFSLVWLMLEYYVLIPGSKPFAFKTGRLGMARG